MTAWSLLMPFSMRSGAYRRKYFIWRAPFTTPAFTISRCATIGAACARRMGADIDSAGDGNHPFGETNHRPNSRSISQPSKPFAASGRTEARVGAGRGAAEGNGLSAVLAAFGEERTCAMVASGSTGCEAGRATGETP